MRASQLVLALWHDGAFVEVRGRMSQNRQHDEQSQEGGQGRHNDCNHHKCAPAQHHEWRSKHRTNAGDHGGDEINLSFQQQWTGNHCQREQNQRNDGADNVARNQKGPSIAGINSSLQDAVDASLAARLDACVTGRFVQ